MRGRGPLSYLAWAVAALALLLVLASSGLWWTVRSDSGTVWLLSHLPGVKVSGGKGTLLGDFAADRVEFQLPRGGGTVAMTGFGWSGLRIARYPWSGPGAHVSMTELHAARVDLQLVPSGKKEPPTPPSTLRLPLELDVPSLHVGEFHAAALGDKPLRDLHAGLHLNDDGGARHRIDGLSLAWDRLEAKASARIGTQAPFALDLKLDASQDASTSAPTAWNASAALSGPLEQPLLRATVRALPTAGQREQSLDARATLRPFAAWPLAELQASTRQLDLSAFHSAAPVTALSGEAVAKSTGIDQPATVRLALTNAEAGRWNEGRLPVRELTLALGGRPDDRRAIDLHRIDAELGTRQQAGGRLQGQGRWTPEQWKLDTIIKSLQPSLLDARAAAMQLSGPVALVGSGFDAATPERATVEVKADLAGQLSGRGAARAAQLKLDASLNTLLIELRDMQAVAGAARASLKGLAAREAAGAPWHLKGDAALVDFDPVPWWPGREDSPWRKGPHRLNAKGDFDLTVPAATGMPSGIEQWAAVRGHAGVSLANSVLAGVPLAGVATLRSVDGGTALANLEFDAGGNTVGAQGRLSTAKGGAQDQWDMTLTAPALNRVAPLWRLLRPPGADATLAGAVNGTASVTGRWPNIATQGQVQASGLLAGAAGAQTAQLRWQMDGGANAAVDVQASASQVVVAQSPSKVPPLESLTLQLKGTLRDHGLELRAESKALPPAWTDALQAKQPVPAPTAAPGVAPVSRTVALLKAQGALIETPAVSGVAPSRFAGWRGSVLQLELRGSAADATPLLRLRDVGIEAQWAGGPTRAIVQPGRAEVLGAALRWSRIAWQAALGSQPAQLDAQAELEPLPVAPLLARAQPEFGWGGDLAIVGHINVRSAPTFVADIVLERQRGDLAVTDETGSTQALGLTDLRFGLDARDGVWSFTQALAGKTLGVAAGAVVARTTPVAIWPAAETPIQGVLEVQVANLGTWGPWVPPGWRLTGALRTSASVGGRFGAPEYTGEMRGSGLGVRNFLQGVDVKDGELSIALQGATARIDRFTARAGAGTVKLEGDASLGETPRAQLKLLADKFQLLGRVDRRIVASGNAQMQLDRETLSLDGKFRIDEGLIDFTRSDAPRLSDDVEVIRGKRTEATDAAAANGSTATSRKVRLDLQVALGDQLRLRGHGIDTGLRGELRITSPGGRLALNGTVQAVDGTYAAYGQKLTIERGLITFNGPAENPRLDIEATRPNTDIRVGVLVTGTALNPRVRLFSEPEMSDLDKLSWLVLGRASDGLGRTDTALLQRAAIALLAGEGEGPTDQFTRAIGLDEVSLRQTDGEVRETIITLGKQLSRRWYVGYERGLNATTGSWQLIYRVARRFTLRAQSGLDNSLDLIWTWRWQ